MQGWLCRAQDLQTALDVAAKLLPMYERTLNVAYALPKLDLVAIPDFEEGAMENWGLITFRETDLLATNDSGVLGTRRVTSVIAHEMAHLVRACMAPLRASRICEMQLAWPRKVASFHRQAVWMKVSPPSCLALSALQPDQQESASLHEIPAVCALCDLSCAPGTAAHCASRRCCSTQAKNQWSWHCSHAAAERVLTRSQAMPAVVWRPGDVPVLERDLAQRGLRHLLAGCRRRCCGPHFGLFGHLLCR